MIDTQHVSSGGSPHPYAPDACFDGGDLGCGNGLLLLIRTHIDPLDPGRLLEICSVDATVEVDLPAWCRLTGNELVHVHRGTARGAGPDGQDLPRRRFLVSKGAFDAPGVPADPSEAIDPSERIDPSRTGGSRAPREK